jgi:tetrahydromethanopterin S-methyltransferase subunit A
MIGEIDATAIVARARVLAALPVAPVSPGSSPAAPPADPADVEVVVASRDPSSSWEYDPVGYFLVFVDRPRRLLRAEQYTQDHRLTGVFEGRRAEELCHTIVRSGAVTLLAHAAYLGRELAKAELALALELEYDQDRPLSRSEQTGGATAGNRMEETDGDSSGSRGAP